jgi:NodT family efflux transporter outer membrane factor (OMF) lipoprotein
MSMAQKKHYKDNKMRMAIKYFLLPILSVGVVSCASVPRANITKSPIDSSKMAISAQSATIAASWPKEYWWSKYPDQQLQNLIYRALSNSPTLDIAEARIEQALQYARAVDAVSGISGSADATTFFQKQSYNYIMGSFAPRGFKDYGQMTVGIKKDLDLWGKDKAQLNAAVYQLDAAGTEKEFAKVNLASAILAEYAKLQNLYNQRDLAEQLLATTTEYSSLMDLRYKNGLDNKGTAAQANSNIHAIKLQINKLDENIALEKSAIAALVGVGQQLANEIKRPTIKPLFGFKIPQNLTLDIIGHRADIVAARLNVEAQSENIKVKKAQYYPNISLSGNVGLQSFSLGKLFDSGSLIGQVGPAISLPLFAQDALNSQYYGAQADYNMAVANYNQKVIDAMGEVDQVAVNFAALDAQITNTKAQIASLNTAYDIAQKRYKGGIGTKLEVLNLKNQIINNTVTLNNLMDANLNLEIALIKALGGGYQNNSQ